jgi:putative colanic acid biosysnthesis UDP-glucose lipid carrier transferase
MSKASDMTAVLPAAGLQTTTDSSQSLTKRGLDLSVALVLMLFLAPLLIVVALAVKSSSKGPVFFRQRRAGLGGQPFHIYKFRTMSVCEDGEVVTQARQGDARVTKVGAFLRKSSIDELPQLLNVIKGDMSLVGPRPHALAHDRYYSELIPAYGDRFRAKPGITGWAQVNGARGETDTLDKMVRRIELDNDYISRWSCGLDMWILVKTGVVAPFQSTAY